jgi:uncharacterized protein YjbI with pentapeptide repeats
MANTSQTRLARRRCTRRTALPFLGLALVVAIVTGVASRVVAASGPPAPEVRCSHPSRWRPEARDFKRKADLCNADLRGADLSDFDLRAADLSGADLRGAYLWGTNLKKASLRGAHFDGADLTNANLVEANLRSAHMQNARLVHAALSGADARGADMHGSNLTQANFIGATLTKADLHGSLLIGGIFFGADLIDANFTSATLFGAKFLGTHLRGTDLRVANLSRADLRGTTWSEANLTGADLNGALPTDTDWSAASAKRGLDAYLKPDRYLGCRKERGWRLSVEDVHRIVARHYGWLQRIGYFDLNARDRYLDNVTPTYNGWRNDARAHPEQAILCNADLRGANLAGATLTGVNLSQALLDDAILSHAELAFVAFYDASMTHTQLEQADLMMTNLGHAMLIGANLNGANLSGADLDGADLSQAQVSKSRLDYVDLTNATYAPVSEPPNPYVTHIKGLGTLNLAFDATGLVQLRKLLHDAELRDEERQATYAIERSRTTEQYASAGGRVAPFFRSAYLRLSSYFNRFGYINGSELRAQPAKAARGSAWIESIFRILGFDVTTAYGMNPSHALVLIAELWAIFTFVYLWPIIRVPQVLSDAKHTQPLGTGGVIGKTLTAIRNSSRFNEWRTFWTCGGIYQVLPADRIEELSAEPTVEKELKWRRVDASHKGHALTQWLDAFRKAAYFSLLSAVNIGFEQFTPGDWIRRLQGREYSLQAIGWVRFVAGVQALLSVYLLAMWVLTQFGRPFE